MRNERGGGGWGGKGVGGDAGLKSGGVDYDNNNMIILLTLCGHDVATAADLLNIVLPSLDDVVVNNNW